MSEVELHRGAALERAPSSMLESVMQMMAQPGKSAAELRELLIFGKELEAEKARRDYIVAFQSAKRDMLTMRIQKNGRIVYKDNKGTVKFAKYDDIADAVQPILARNGLTASFSYEFVAAPPKTICVMTLLHESGHEKEFRSVPLPMIDSSGGKTDIQGAGSIGSYGRRYTVVPAFDIITEDEDDDGSGKGVALPITEDQLITIEDIVRACADKDPRFTALFKKWMLVELKTDDPAQLLQGDQLKTVMGKLAEKQKMLGLL